MHRRKFLGAAAFAGLSACAPQERRPTNLVFILTDDQAPDTLGVYGNPEIQTPNLDRLARSGARLTQAFCTTPVCSPSRATLLTGQIPSQHGIHDWIRDESEGEDAYQFLADQPTFTEILAHHGYRVGLSGKWHMGDCATPQEGFDYWFAMPGGGSRYQDPEFYQQGEKVEFEGYTTDVITDAALRFIDEAHVQPFCAFVSYNAPHTPYEGTPEKYLAMYRDSDFETFADEPLNEPIAHNLSKRNVGNRESKIHYYAMITAIDDNVGRILDKLEELNLTESTLVVFLSDHGFLLEQHGLWGKGNTSWPYNCYDESLRVPAVFAHPGGIPAGTVIDEPTSFYDFAPTVLDYLDMPSFDDALPPLRTEKRLPGRSYAPFLRGETVPGWPEDVYGEYQYCRFVREPGWKLIRRTEGFPSELYNLEEDPGERVNLYDDPAHEGERKRLEAKLDHWFDSLGCGDPDLWKHAEQKVLPSYQRVTGENPG